jgi:hypothetical protein
MAKEATRKGSLASLVDALVKPSNDTHDGGESVVTASSLASLIGELGVMFGMATLKPGARTFSGKDGERPDTVSAGVWEYHAAELLVQGDSGSAKTGFHGLAFLDMGIQTERLKLVQALGVACGANMALDGCFVKVQEITSRERWEVENSLWCVPCDSVCVTHVFRS